MSDRIVVSFWMPHAGLASEKGRGFLERARALTQRAEALGAALIAFGTQVCAFAFDPESLEEAIGCATAVGEETLADEVGWGCGVAEGPIEPFLARSSAAPSTDARGGLAWGPSAAAGAALARIARPGQVLVHASLKGKGELVTLGARLRRDGGRRVRGAILDVQQPWRSAAAANVSRVKTPPLIGREDPSALAWVPGAVAVLRADPGLGGTRVLQEVAEIVAPGPSLLVAPVGAGLEPLGALRRALARAKASAAPHLEPHLAPALHRLLAGDGVSLDTAAAIVSSFLLPPAPEPAGVLLIDDAKDVDPTTLEACARAVGQGKRSFPCVVRLDALAPPPTALTHLPKGTEVDLRPLDEGHAAALAAAALGGALDETSRKRWARRGGSTPLGVLEALAASLSSGELAWTSDAVVPRRRSAGRGRPRAAREWIVERARLLASPVEQLVLAIVALLGGEARVERLDRVLAGANVPVKARDAAQKLVLRRWLVSPEPGWFALPTRTHREALLGELTDDALRALIHRAIARTLQEEERGLGLSEVAHHLARAGDAKRAAQAALGAARVAGLLDLPQGATHLLAYARELDPAVEEEARAELASQLPTRGSNRPPPPDESRARAADTTDVGAGAAVRADVTVARAPAGIPRGAHDSEPPTVMNAKSPDELPPASEPGTILGVAPTTETEPGGAVDEPPNSQNLDAKLTELAKEALLGADTRALERWTEGLLASGARGRFADRMRAILSLSRGDVGEALRVLRAARAEMDAGASREERCQTALALGVALAVAGRTDEALLEALDALARAREARDDKAAHACVAFLAKLYASVERGEDAARLRRFTRMVDEGRGGASA